MLIVLFFLSVSAGHPNASAENELLRQTKESILDKNNKRDKQHPRESNRSVNVTSLFSSAEFLANQYKPEQIASNELDESFVQPRDSYGIGNTEKTYWYKANLSSLFGSSQTQFLEIPFPILDKVDVWFFDSQNNLVSHSQAGAYYPHSERDLKTNTLLFPVPANTDLENVVIAINSASIINFSAIYWTEKQWLKNQSRSNQWYGILFGGTAILLLYNLFLAGALRDSSYLYYVLYLFGLTLINGINAGVGDHYLFNEHAGFSSRSLLFLVALTNIFDFLFINKFLEVKKFYPKFWKISVVLMFAILPPAIPELLGYTDLGVVNGLLVLLVISISFIGWIFYLSLSIAVYRNGYKQARFFIIAFLSFNTCYIAYQLFSFQVLHYSWLTSHILEIGTLVEGLLLSLALADRINILSDEKNKAENESISINKIFTRRFIQAQEKERELFSNALHDSIGHSLLVLKQNIQLISTSNENESFNEQRENTLQKLRQQSEHCSEIMSDVKHMSLDLHPLKLKSLGLKKAIEAIVKVSFSDQETECNLLIDEMVDEVSSEKQLTIYRVIQECINNIIKHSLANKVTIEVSHLDEDIRILVTDNGSGLLETKRGNEGIGLLTMRGRIELFGGVFEASSSPSFGTKIYFSMPKNEPQAEIVSKIERRSANRIQVEVN